MQRSLTFITGNGEKAKLLSYYLKFPIAHQKIDLVEIQSLDLATIIEYKAREAYKYVGSPVLVEDTSLRFFALGKLPGPLIKWFLTELGTCGLCQLLDGYADRSALAEINFGLYDGKTLQTFANSREGFISAHPLGDNGFGWDPIFVPRGYEKTWGEMTIEEQQESSLRKPALEKLEHYLKTL